MGQFINPYTFVPFPGRDAVLDRGEPAGHDRPVADGWHGTIEWEFECVSPLLVRWPTAEARTYDVPHRPGADGSRRPVLPGSSVHGAMRALHEILAGGCLRVFDPQFSPSYRDPMREGGFDRWRLARVEQVDNDGRPTQVRLSEPTTRVKGKLAFSAFIDAAALPPNLTSGDRLTISLPEASDVMYRPEYKQVTSVRRDADGDWVVLLTDGGTRYRKAEQSNGPRPQERVPTAYFIAAGRLGSRTIEVTDAAWAAYRTAALGSDDYRRANQQLRQSLRAAEEEPRDGAEQAHPGARELAFADYPAVRPIPVEHENARGGSRHPVYPFLHPGQVVWARVENETVVELKASWFWRHSGEGTSADRVPPGLLPCREPDALCPSCRMFGSAEALEPGTEQAGPAAQFSYRGHVRVQDAIAAEDARIEQVRLAPMGAPRPGAGQFYLRTGGPGGKGRPQMAGEHERPLREWGSGADDGQARMFRGRKMYWRTTDTPPRQRFKARSHHSEELVSSVKVFTAGSRFAVRLTVENLTAAQVGALVCTLDPARLFHRARAKDSTVAAQSRPEGLDAADETFVVPLGGGKPFGFGSCATRAIRLHRLDPAARYRHGDDGHRLLGDDETDALVDAFVGGDHPEWLRRQWSVASRALRLGHVDGSLVWYPPGADWRVLEGALALPDSDERQEAERNFDSPFAFFQNSVGWQRVTKKGVLAFPLTELPTITEADQRLEIEK
ncbi:TIGR03986 family type III CRISPR-associated RAMP protein [Mangrovihabitans endophyticus]|uniref:CRISPR-associated protein n=1 Tax=Mangrovihabitans endophyticus TaxID=1751298 RepID=A0A8J3C415_9ACTN|nr:TIGR03986 family CRISPR-associated RAMP protein [Mangrovihabitans endophyticus]GGL05094.1 hypothetical protein GCM10012284_44550 [Mangrovihabitans endophyticus]